MAKREIVFMVCRLIAVYMFLNSLTMLGETLTAFRFIALAGSSTTTTGGVTNLTVNLNSRPATPLWLALLVVFELLPTLLNWAAAIGFWVLAREITVRLFESSPEVPEGETRFTFGAEVRAVAFACVGLFFLAQDVPGVLVWSFNWLWTTFSWTTHPVFIQRYYNSGLEWLVRIPFSLWLVFGLRGLAGLWKMAQERGVAPVGLTSRSVEKQ